MVLKRAGSLSQSSAASPFRGDALSKVSNAKAKPDWSGEGSSLVWLSEQRLQAQQDGLDVVRGGPLVLENIETNAAGEVDVRVVDGGLEKDGRRRVWVVCGELEAELEREAGVGGVLRALDGGAPVQEVAVGRGKRRHTGRRRGHQLHKLRLQPASLIDGQPQGGHNNKQLESATKCTSSPLNVQDSPFRGILAGITTLLCAADLAGYDTAWRSVLAVLHVRHDC